MVNRKISGLDFQPIQGVWDLRRDPQENSYVGKTSTGDVPLFWLHHLGAPSSAGLASLKSAPKPCSQNMRPATAKDTR
jgi:hypothetical protein